MSKTKGGASAAPCTSLPAPLRVDIINKSKKYSDNERDMEGRKW
jgi:hypothetical protein